MKKLVPFLIFYSGFAFSAGSYTYDTYKSTTTVDDLNACKVSYQITHKVVNVSEDGSCSIGATTTEIGSIVGDYTNLGSLSGTLNLQKVNCSSSNTPIYGDDEKWDFLVYSEYGSNGCKHSTNITKLAFNEDQQNICNPGSLSTHEFSFSGEPLYIYAGSPCLGGCYLNSISVDSNQVSGSSWSASLTGTQTGELCSPDTPSSELFTVSEPTEQEPTEQEPTEQEPTEQEPTEQEPTEQEPTEQDPTDQEPTSSFDDSGIISAIQDLKSQGADNHSDMVSRLDAFFSGSNFAEGIQDIVQSINTASTKSSSDISLAADSLETSIDNVTNTLGSKLDSTNNKLDTVIDYLSPPTVQETSTFKLEVENQTSLIESELDSLSGQIKDSISHNEINLSQYASHYTFFPATSYPQQCFSALGSTFCMPWDLVRPVIQFLGVLLMLIASFRSLKILFE